jgi:excisionase family DNA binding protein
MALIETKDMLTTTEAAKLLGDGTRPGAIRLHCQRGTIKATKVGDSWLINKKDLANFRESRRSRGRPKTA